jgi:hypothetical protein
MAMNGDPSQRTGRLLSEQELAKLLNISVRHLMNLRKAGLPHLQLGVAIRYDLQEVWGHIRDRRMVPSRDPLAAGLRFQEDRP